MAHQGKYLPAMGFFFLANLYDPLMKLGLRETKFKTRLIRHAKIQPSSRVLDLGCGTATLMLMIKMAFPQAKLVGLDGDRKILSVARRKISLLGLDIQLDEAFSFDMPYPDNIFNRVVSSLVFHHLAEDNQRSTLQEVLRVLKPGGQLHIADFAAPHGQRGHLTSHLLPVTHPTKQHEKLHLLKLMSEEGFSSIHDCGRFFTIFGRISFFSGAKPGLATKVFN